MSEKYLTSCYLTQSPLYDINIVDPEASVPCQAENTLPSFQSGQRLSIPDTSRWQDVTQL